MVDLTETSLLAAIQAVRNHPTANGVLHPDGIALTSSPHPSGPAVAEDVDVNSASVEHGTMDDETGRIEWSAELDAAQKILDRHSPIFHFVMDRDGAGPQLWMRNQINDWFMVRFGWSPAGETPEVHAMAFGLRDGEMPEGYRYLSPAEYESPITSQMYHRVRADRDAATVECQRQIERADHYEAECKRLADGPPIAATPEDVAAYWLKAERNYYRASFDDAALVRLREVIRAARLHGRQSVVGMSEPGDHNYHGPLDADRKPISDPVHEQVHRVVGDILAGKVMQPARRQLQEALKHVPKEKPPFPLAVVMSDNRRMGR